MSSSNTTYPNIKVRAEALNLFVDAFKVFPSLADKYVGRLGIDREGKPTGTEFIALDAWLRLFETVLADIGPNAVFQMGQRIIHNPNFSTATRKLEEALRQIDIAYHKSHRKNGVEMFNPASGLMLEGIGHYLVDLDSQKKLAVTCDTPYPCPLEHGIVSGIATQFEPRAIVTHDKRDRCRMNGGTRCKYLVSW